MTSSPGGITFWLVEEPAIPIVSVEISFEGGGAVLEAEGSRIGIEIRGKAIEAVVAARAEAGWASTSG